jgi:hypothetical protein
MAVGFAADSSKYPNASRRSRNGAVRDVFAEGMISSQWVGEITFAVSNLSDSQHPRYRGNLSEHRY